MTDSAAQKLAQYEADKRARAFVTFPSPDPSWARGFGAALTTTFFGVTALEAEAARVPLETATGTMTSFTANALVQLPIAALVPYFGVGFGVYRQSISDLGETSTSVDFVSCSSAQQRLDGCQ